MQLFYGCINMKVYEESIFGRTAYRKHTYRKLFGSNKTVCRA